MHHLMKLLLALLLFTSSINASNLPSPQQNGPSGYDLLESSKDYIKNLYRCRRSGLGCTMQDKLALAEIEGKVLNFEAMNAVLAQDSERG
ncbi:MAG: hypothetical protein ACK5V3_03510, partial [Bdellovibrionales bacterium]